MALSLATAAPLADLLGAQAPHPIHPVAIEWTAPLVWPAPWVDLWQDHGDVAVHAWHRLVFHRPLALPLVRCRLSGAVVAQAPTSAGALTEVRYRATDDGGPLWSTQAGVLWRGLDTVERGSITGPEIPAPGGSSRRVKAPVGPDFAHQYSVASGIWNPVHTDPSAARAAGFAAPILHGSASLALALTAVLDLAGPGAISEVRARFVAPVIPPDDLVVVVGRSAAGLIPVELRRGDGSVAVQLAASLHTAEGRHLS